MIWFLHWLLHVTGGDNGAGAYYLELSGAVADILIPGALLAFWRKHNCHDRWCWRWGHEVQANDGSSFIFCHRHHPMHPRKKRHLTSKHKESIFQ